MEREQTVVVSDTAKKAYAKPQVADFGALQDLTLGASGAFTDDNGMMEF